MSTLPSTAPGAPQPEITPPSSTSTVDWYKIAKANFDHAERYKTQNCEWRYRISDEIYLSATKAKVWEGTKVRRASMPYYVALAQIESLLPHVIGALFNDDLPINARPFPGTTGEQSRAVMELIRWQLLNLDPEVGPVPFFSLRELFRAGYKSDLIYGNQVVEFGWLTSQRQRTRYDKLLVPTRIPFIDPMSGQQMDTPTGEFHWEVSQRDYTESVSKPIAQHVDVRDFYWDPNCTSSLIQKARYCCRRQFPTVSELLDLAGQPGFTIPGRDTLLDLAKRRSTRPADSSKQLTETARGNNWNPSLEYNDNPDLTRVEVIRYFQRDRICWIVPNGPRAASSEEQKDDLILYSAPNEYQMLPFLTSAYTDVPGRWFGLSICELTEGDQKLAQTILDARLDELNLLIHPPIIRRRGSMAGGATQKRLRPGAEWEVDGNPNEVITRMEMGNVTAQAFAEVDALDRRAQKTTGVTDAAVVGSAAVGGNSALRSATGVRTLAGAASTRIQYQVENKQDHILVPLVSAIHWLNKRFLDPSSTQAILGADWSQKVIDNVDVMNADCHFEWEAGSRMRAKEALKNGGLEIIMQSALNSPFVQQLGMAGLIPNYAEISAMVCTATDQPPRSLFVPMTPEQQQAFQQQQQASADAVRMQMQQQRLEAQESMQEQSGEMELIKAVLKQLPPEVIFKALGMKPPPVPKSGGKK